MQVGDCALAVTMDMWFYDDSTGTSQALLVFVSLDPQLEEVSVLPVLRPHLILVLALVCPTRPAQRLPPSLLQARTKIHTMKVSLATIPAGLTAHPKKRKGLCGPGHRLLGNQSEPSCHNNTSFLRKRSEFVSSMCAIHTYILVLGGSAMRGHISTS